MLYKLTNMLTELMAIPLTKVMLTVFRRKLILNSPPGLWVMNATRLTHPGLHFA